MNTMEEYSLLRYTTELIYIDKIRQLKWWQFKKIRQAKQWRDIQLTSRSKL